MNAPQQTLCGELNLQDDGFLYCGWPAIGPHPVDGYVRPLCAQHMKQAEAEIDRAGGEP